MHLPNLKNLWRQTGRGLRITTVALPLLVLAGGAALYRPHPVDDVRFATGTIPNDHILLPQGPAQAVVVLISDSGGWGATDLRLARDLQARHAAVVGVDLPTYLANLAAKPETCHYLISDIESLSHQIQRATGSAAYQAPILAGAGVGGGLALDLTAQTPAATVGATVVADPGVAVPLDRPLCTAASHTETRGGAVYALPSRALADPVTVLLSPAVDANARARVDAFAAAAPGATVSDRPGTSGDLLATALTAQVAALTSAPAALPLQVLATTATHGTMAIILSGDGGWRDLDRTVGGVLQSDGIPTVGVDSLRYFWTKRTPQDVARDIEAIVAQYGRRWNTPDVLLMGYSFGADVLPETWAALDPATQARVRQISLLGLSRSADWQITVSGWLGGPSSDARPTGPALARIPPSLVQCVYGTDETDSPCPALAGRGAEAIRTKGGHHFDGNYPALAQDVVAGIDGRRSHSVGVQQVAAAGRPHAIATSTP